MAPGGATLYGLAPKQQQVVSFHAQLYFRHCDDASRHVFRGLRFQLHDPVGERILHVRAGPTPPWASNNNGDGVGGQLPTSYAFTVTGGALTPMAGQPFHENADALTGIVPTNPVAGATSNDSRFLFIANQGTHNISVFRIIPSSGTAGTRVNRPRFWVPPPRSMAFLSLLPRRSIAAAVARRRRLSPWPMRTTRCI